jgi:hypothetical protein
MGAVKFLDSAGMLSVTIDIELIVLFAILIDLDSFN